MTWNDWHIIYNDKESAPYKRSIITQELVNNYLNIHKKNIIILSICSGQARDILPAIAGREDKDRITTYLLDIDKDCLEYAQEYARIHDIPNVHTINKDASLKESYDDIPKVDLIVICGLFGHLVPEDIATTALFLQTLIEDNATVIWSRNKFFNDHSDNIRNIFWEAKLKKYQYDSFIDVLTMGKSPLVLVASSKSQVNTPVDFVKLIATTQKPINVAIGGGAMRDIECHARSALAA